MITPSQFRFVAAPVGAHVVTAFWAILLGAAAVLVAGPIPVAAQDVQSLSETVSRLERQLQTLERNIYRSGGAPAGGGGGGVAPSTASTGGGGSSAGVAQLNVRVGEVEEQLRQITGDVERIGFDVGRLSSRLDKLVTDFDFRLRSLEKGGVPSPGMADSGPDRQGTPQGSGQPGTLGTLTESQLRAAGVEATPPAAAPRTGTVAVASQGGQSASTGGAVTLPAGEPSAQYEYAFSFLMRRDFPGAEQAFSQFVAAHPEDELAGNAQYWLGETYYVRNDFPNAARTFAEGFQRYPDSGKAADNLLKLGLSLAALDRNQDACITFAKLAASYPGAPSNILQRGERESGKLGCN